ncbi:MAG: hypothetical protein CGU28_00580 [Candidatus Dactylopiibacterium carminicum]|uniref:Chemotaxis protein CheA n=1 Tax=Candidatus Dactylopiibacterium carminicum TaxID=857335 RepID=A0A272EYU8_9RHOO|nr:ATP-binding protein [Candidatus Dactylopiibacterium carminicum]KAF7600809.1 hypothetical protein BGI27_00195 [Candidatus Dactylopiibacterium carminicum]PAS95308.1 MAG: hypothetical protein CGU29_00230 [Candidatus Dactylopiibacterium carminicum]PAS98680.1 MAG: hypothetical protein CGU28_00580 [Candidatus Dactylopiibacterium carminicum]PAT00816.1 MAG: hypothetical protein BSR46_00195 [Candidatus Dactylopiibacterium carminicum]
MNPGESAQLEWLPLFVAESKLLLDSLEARLLELEHQPQTRETLDAIFRAAHSLKGNATVARQIEIEWLVHVMESVLTRLRNGELRVDGGLVSALLACCDHLRFLVNQAHQPDTGSPIFANADRTQLIGLLVPYLDVPPDPAPLPATGAGQCWQIRVSFGSDALRRGLDPLNFLHHLETLGRICTLRTCTERLPEEDFDPESCYLGFEILLDSKADKQALEDAFAFASEVCELSILPPAQLTGRYRERLESLPDDDLQTGEMLVRVGAITPAELAASLRRQRAGATVPLGGLLVAEGYINADVVEAALARQAQARQIRSRNFELLHLPRSRIESLQQTLTALRTGLAEAVPDLAQLRAMADVLQEQARALQETRYSEHLHRLHRIVRDASYALGKQTELLVTGADIFLDNVLAEALDEMLLHLLRNAVDHGIEPPAVRQALGKPTTGTISITLLRRQDSFQVSVRDDGTGIDRHHLLDRALALGYPTGQAGSEEDLLQLVFSPGFSTAAGPGAYSGRGVGLDLVRERIRALGGDIQLSSRTGKGCLFKLTFPVACP